QIVRDARAPMLYEGANGIQALDLVGRKLVRDDGRMFDAFLARVRAQCHEVPDELQAIASAVAEGAQHLEEAGRWLLSAAARPDDLGAGAYPFLLMVGVLATGWMWLRIARIAQPDASDPF